MVLFWLDGTWYCCRIHGDFVVGTARTKLDITAMQMFSCIIIGRFFPFEP